MPCPHSLGGMFLVNKTTTWQTFFKIIYPVIATNKKVDEYALMINYFQVLAAGNYEESLLNATRPVAPSHSKILIKEYAKRVRGFFSPHQLDVADAQQSNIATTLVYIIAAQDKRYKDKKAANELSASSTVESFLREHRLLALLNMTGCRDEGELNKVLPIYLQLAKAKKAARLDLFQAAVNHVLNE